METIVIQGNYTLLRSSYTSVYKLELEIEVEQGLVAHIAIDTDSNEVTTTIVDIPVQDGFCDSMIGVTELAEVPELYVADVKNINKLLLEPTKQIISIIKYYLGYYDISESLFSVRTSNWGVTQASLSPIPSGFSSAIDARSMQPLNDDGKKMIEEAAKLGLKPLVGMRHLHRAKSEKISHHKWIDATIAAELAVKEVLSTAVPNLDTLLMELPSPPLVKLYGSILETYLGEKSPYLNKIRKGVEVRNKLIHRPLEHTISNQDAIDYVNDIEAAIFHLLGLIYPSNTLIRRGNRKNLSKNGS